MENNSFDKWQADYAAHGVATFPVDANKRPMVSRYNQFGLIGSAKIATKFSNVPVIGFMCGKRNGITSLDCDSKISGSLDDLPNLPTMQNVPVEACHNSKLVAEVKQGQRNNRLFSACLEAARHCDDFDALCDVARTRNNEFLPPLEDDELMRIAASAWRDETEGTNYIGRRRAVFSEADVLPLMADPHVGMLKVWAKAKFKPDAHFWIADGLADKFQWSTRQLRQARRRAVQTGIFRLITPAGFKRNAVYGWGLREPRGKERGVC